MECRPADALAVLQRTPATLRILLGELPDVWTRQNEGRDTWSPYDVIGHLIHGERTDWIPRARIILEHGESQPFEPFDRFAQLDASKGKSLGELLDTFARLRQENLAALEAMKIAPGQWDLRGRHPALGVVTLRALLASWVVHDLDHIGQIAATMAKQYGDAVGVWKPYMGILNR